MKPSPQHPRIRKTVKWGGAVVSVLLLVVWVGSGWFGISCRSSLDDRAVLAEGQFVLVVGHEITARSVSASWTFSRGGPRFGWSPGYGGGAGYSFAIVPLGMIAGPLILCTAMAWCFDEVLRKRRRSGFCPKCNYNRAGLASQAVCPECGAAAMMPPPAVS